MKRSAISLVLTIILSVSLAQDENEPLKYKVRVHKNTGAAPPVLFLMHGYNGNKGPFDDAMSIIDDRFLIVSMEAPYTFLFGLLNRWFEWDVIDGDTTSNQKQIDYSIQKVLTTMEVVQHQYNYNTERVYLGGFSQGGIMAFSLGLRYPEKLAGIFSHSARLPVEYSLKSPDTIYEELSVLIIHGTEDSFSSKWSKQAEGLFKKLGSRSEYFEDKIGHEMSEKTIQKIDKWLGEIL